MRWAQIRAGGVLHLVYEPGEGPPGGDVVRAGSLSAPLCGTRAFRGVFRITSNMSLGQACANCTRISEARRAGGGGPGRPEIKTVYMREHEDGYPVFCDGRGHELPVDLLEPSGYDLSSAVREIAKDLKLLLGIDIAVVNWDERRAIRAAELLVRKRGEAQRAAE